MALLIGLKQVSPEKEWNFSKLSVRAKQLPFIFLILSVVLSFFLLSKGSGSLEFGFWGLLVGWTYLRYFQYRDGAKGDQTLQFKFSSIFPEVFQPFVEFLSRLCCFCFQKKKQTELDADVLKYTVLDSPADAERRRQLATKVLDEKLQNMKDLPKPTIENVGPNMESHVTTFDDKK